MSPPDHLATFELGAAKVEILAGNLLEPGDLVVQALASTDDNYLSMGAGGIADLLKRRGGPEYFREARAQTPVRAGEVVVTQPHGLVETYSSLEHVFLHHTGRSRQRHCWPKLRRFFWPSPSTNSATRSSRSNPT